MNFSKAIFYTMVSLVFISASAMAQQNLQTQVLASRQLRESSQASDLCYSTANSGIQQGEAQRPPHGPLREASVYKHSTVLSTAGTLNCYVLIPSERNNLLDVLSNSSGQLGCECYLDWHVLPNQSVAPQASQPNVVQLPAQ